MAKSNNKYIYVFAFALLLAGLSFLIFSGVSENSVYFVNVSEAAAIPPEKLDSARLFGIVDGKDLQGGPGTKGAKFRLLDKDDQNVGIMVDYAGAVPDTFKPGAEVIVEGGMKPASGIFKAGTLMTKCPSKYEKIREEEKAGS